MKRTLILLLIVGLVGGSIVGPAAAKKKKKKPKQTPVTYLLRRDGCNTDADNPHLSVVDGPDAACVWSDAGLLWDVYSGAGLLDPSEVYPATDGVPFVLDATKPLTGEITLYGPQCVAGPACAPGPISAGNAVFTMDVIGEVGGEEKVLGTFEDQFTAVPGETHTSSVSIEIDPALDKLAFDALRIEVYHGGQAYGPGGIEYDDPASFIVVPTWAKPGAVPANPATPPTPAPSPTS